MDIFAHLRGLVVEALRRLLPDLPEEAFARVVVEPPRIDPRDLLVPTNPAVGVPTGAPTTSSVGRP